MILERERERERDREREIETERETARETDRQSKFELYLFWRKPMNKLLN